MLSVLTRTKFKKEELLIMLTTQMNGTDIILTDRSRGLTFQCDRNVLYFGRAVDYMSTKQSYTFGRTYPKIYLLNNYNTCYMGI